MKSNKFKIFFIIILLIIAVFYVLSLRQLPRSIAYGVSFSKFHADELQLDWKKTLLAILDGLKVHNIRLTAHWPMIEPVVDKFNFSEMDFQMNETRKRDVSVVLAVGRRLPGWPECHEPDWLMKQATSISDAQASKEYKQQMILKYIESVVKRYRSYGNLKYWQVENEPYLAFFSRSLCGPLDEGFLQKEIDLVHRLDPIRQVIITDSGEFGTWYQAYRHGDIFGSSVYLYVWWKIGPLRYPLTPAFFRIKENLIDLFFGKKPKILIELSGEPWLRVPMVGAPIKILLDRMGIDKLNEMIDFGSKTGFDIQYLWGAEWWYWMKKTQNHPEFWTRASELFK